MHIKYCIGVFYSFKTSINKLLLFILMPIYRAYRESCINANRSYYNKCVGIENNR